jgi:hypothetical protein
MTPTRGARAAYPLLLALGALDATGYSVIVPVAPAIADATDAGPATIGLLVASFPTGMVLGFALAARSSVAAAPGPCSSAPSLWSRSGRSASCSATRWRSTSPPVS